MGKIKIILTSLIVCALFGCATAPAQMYRPKAYDGPAWQIEAMMKPGLIDSEISIKINGKDVIVDKFSDFQSTAEYFGEYEGHKITSSLTRTRGPNIQVMVFVDGERAATF